MAPYRHTSLYSHTSGQPSFRRSKILRMLLTFRVNAKSTLNQIKPAICQILNCLGSLLTFQAVMLNHTVNSALWISLEPSHVSINMKQTIYLLTIMLKHTVNSALWISLEPSHVSINMKQTIYLLTVMLNHTVNSALCISLEPSHVSINMRKKQVICLRSC